MAAETVEACSSVFGGLFEIEFVGPVTLKRRAFGYSCHFGLALFMPTAQTTIQPWPITDDVKAPQAKSRIERRVSNKRRSARQFPWTNKEDFPAWHNSCGA